MITCRELVEFLMMYLDGELPVEQRERFDRHLSICSACVVYLNAYVETVRMGKAACAPLDEPVHGDVPEDLVRAILEARGEPRNE